MSFLYSWFNKSTLSAGDRLIHDPNARSDAVKKILATPQYHPHIVKEVAETVASKQVVVIGMAQNPHVKNVRNALTAANIPFTYLEYGSYFSMWGERLAIKMWSGWPTFPQVFVNGVFIGGEDLTVQELKDGTLKKRLEEAASNVENNNQQ